MHGRKNIKKHQKDGMALNGLFWLKTGTSQEFLQNTVNDFEKHT